MDKTRVEEILGLFRTTIEAEYAANAEDPTFDIDLNAGVIIDRGAEYRLIAVPTHDKDHACGLLRWLVAHMDEAPEPFHGVILAFAGWKLDPDTRERVGEMAAVEIETDNGLRGQMIFDITREGGHTQCVFNHLEVSDTPRDAAELGRMQGFFNRPTHTRH